MRRAFAGALLLAALMVSVPAPAQPAPAPAATPGVSAPSGALTSFTLTPEKREKAVAYARARYGLHFASFFWSVVVLLVIIGLRLAPRFRDRAEAFSKRRFWQAAVFVPLLLLTQSVLELPTGIYGQRLALRYDQSVQGWGSWFWDWAKGNFVGLVISIPLVWLLYAILRKTLAALVALVLARAAADPRLPDLRGAARDRSALQQVRSARARNTRSSPAGSRR